MLFHFTSTLTLRYNACNTFSMYDPQKQIYPSSFSKPADFNSPSEPEIPTQPLQVVKKPKGFFRELIEFVIIALIIVVPFRIYIAQPYIVNGASMDPTFKTSDYLIVNQLSKRFEDPARGSVLIFKYPKDPSIYFIKRVIGLPGETVIITDGKVSIKNTSNPEGFALNEPYVKLEKHESFTTTLKKDEYFVMGDNRIGSADSRMWGPVPKANIVGSPIIQLFPISKISLNPGDETSTIVKK